MFKNIKLLCFNNFYFKDSSFMVKGCNNVCSLIISACSVHGETSGSYSDIRQAGRSLPEKNPHLVVVELLHYRSFPSRSQMCGWDI